MQSGRMQSARVSAVSSDDAALPTGITRQSVLDQAGKILASSIFAESRRMSRFLNFAVGEAVNHGARRLKEITIGAEVFDRDVAYDPRIDPIVRVEARRLRAKLRAYYEGPGRNDPIIIDFPKGSYSPVFSARAAARPVLITSPQEPPAMAVLPFVNLSPGPDSACLSDGMTEEIIHALTRIPGLRVFAWNTMSQLRGRENDVSSVARRLEAAHVFRGNVRVNGARIRVTAQLLTSAAEVVWSQKWDREILDIFTVQEEIASAIAAALNLRMQRRPTAPGGRNPECYELCLKGRHHTRERTIEGLRRGIACFKRALSIDDASASAWAGLADTWTLMAEYNGASVRESIQQARAAAERALKLDASSAEAHAALGLILANCDWNWAAAERSFRRALELNDGYANAHHWFAVDCLAMAGRIDEARKHNAIALALDPLSSIIREGDAFLWTLAREYDLALAAFAELTRSDPSFYKGWTSMGRAYLLKSMYAEAIEKLETGRSLAGDLPNIIGALGEAHARAGNRAEARRLLDSLHALQRYRPVHAPAFALIHLGLGEKDAALEWLERGAADRHSPIVALKVHPAYDELRTSPRFAAILQRIGFN